MSTPAMLQTATRDAVEDPDDIRPDDRTATGSASPPGSRAGNWQAEYTPRGPDVVLAGQRQLKVDDGEGRRGRG